MLGEVLIYSIILNDGLFMYLMIVNVFLFNIYFAVILCLDFLIM